MRVGAISYLNALPLVHGLPWSVARATPASLQPRVRAGEFDLALCSVTTALCNDTIYIIPATAIGCNGAVGSVKLVLRDGISDVRRCRRIALDPESNTANLLLNVLLHQYYGVPEGQTSIVTEDADATLIIGDRALLVELRDNEIDLGAVWTKWTGLPFIFATWITRSAMVSRDIVETLTRTRDDNLRNIHELANGDQLKYLTENISYEFGDNEWTGLDLFYKYLIEMDLAPNRPLPIARIVN